MDAPTAIAHLERARSGLRQAMAEWNAADLDCVDQSREKMVAALWDLRAFEGAVSAGEVTPTEELRNQILAVKQEITQATRVVDACVAFHRGLAASSGDAPPVYDAEGRISAEPSGLESEVHA